MEIFAFIAVILLVRQEGHLASKKYHSSNQQKFPPKPFLLSRFCSFMIFMSCNQYQYFYNIHVPVDLALKHLSFCKTWLIFLLFVDHLIFSIHVISWFLIILLFFLVLIPSLHWMKIVHCSFMVIHSCSSLRLSAGSKDGFLRFWKCCQDYRSLTPLFSLPMVSRVFHLLVLRILYILGVVQDMYRQF